MFVLWEQRNQLVHNKEENRNLADNILRAEELRETTESLGVVDRDFLDHDWDNRHTWREANWKRWISHAKAIKSQAENENMNKKKSMDIRNWMRGKGK